MLGAAQRTLAREDGSTIVRLGGGEYPQPQFVSPLAPCGCKAEWNALDREKEIAKPAKSMEIGKKAMSDLTHGDSTPPPCEEMPVEHLMARPTAGV